MTIQELDFLRESNNIESEFDDKSLQDAIIAWQYLRHQMILRRHHILQIHDLLMQSRTTISNEQKGVFRNGSVWIGGKEAKPFYAIESLLHDWIINVDDLVKRGHEGDPFIEKTIRDHHVQYEAIHPFFDGNGRTGRLLYNWERKRCNLPIHVIHLGKEQYDYYNWFK